MNTLANPLNNLVATLTQTLAKSDTMALVRRPPPGAHVPATVPADAPQPITVCAPLLQGRPRTGAVASLPKDKRDMVCRMLANGVVYKKIVQALDELGFVLTERNISNWVTHGGYAEWCVLYQDALQNCLRQDALLEYHRADSSTDLAEVGLQSAAASLSEQLLRHARDPQANPSRLEPMVNLLCRINKELLAVQKHHDDLRIKAFRNPARLQIKGQETLSQIEAKYTDGAKPKLIDDAPPAGGRGSQPAEPGSVTPAPVPATVTTQTAPA